MTDSPPHSNSSYSTIAVVGVGLIGGSLALAARRSGFSGRVLGVSRPASLDEARRLGIIDEGFPYERLVDAAAESDLVVLASPISRIVEHIELLGARASRLRPGTTITDVGSTKQRIVETARRVLPDSIPFIGGHPLAGSELSGVAAADPFLFQNAYYVLTPRSDPPPSGGSDAPDEELSRLARFVETTGARIMLLSARDHDRVAARISHLPQLLAVALVNQLEGLGEHRETAQRLAAGGFRDMTRIASSPYSVWRDILATNQGEVRLALEAFASKLQDETRDLDDATLDDAFERAANTRGGIPRDTKGFLYRLWDVFVEVEDTPNVIAGLSTPLGDKGINIKDIELLKVREGEGGTFRLAFESRALAEEAVTELERAGFRARLRD